MCKITTNNHLYPKVLQVMPDQIKSNIKFAIMHTHKNTFYSFFKREATQRQAVFSGFVCDIVSYCGNVVFD